MPWIGDPSGTGENFGDRWAPKDPDGYAIFRDKLHFYAGKIAAAYAEPDKAESIALWQEVFGPNFQAPPAAPTLAKTASVPAVPTTEQFLDVHYGIQTIPSKHKVTIKGRILPRKGFRTCNLSARGNRVEKGRWLRFEVTSCDVPKPYELYWKVRNTGQEAARVGQLRGEITPDAGTQATRESTAYRGSHYVECFVVKNSVCVASDKQLVFVV